MKSIADAASFAASRAFQEAMFAQGIPVAAIEVGDIQQEFTRLKGASILRTDRMREAAAYGVFGARRGVAVQFNTTVAGGDVRSTCRLMRKRPSLATS
jgi:hypothetical protein